MMKANQRQPWSYCNRLLSCLAAAWLLIGLVPQHVMAQMPTDESKEAWVVSYALVILCVGLGIFIISRPSNRDKKIRKK